MLEGVGIPLTDHLGGQLIMRMEHIDVVEYLKLPSPVVIGYFLSFNSS